MTTRNTSYEDQAYILNKCHNHKSLGLLLGGVLKMSLSLYLYLFGHVMSSHHSDQMSQRSLGLLLGGVLKMSLSLSLYLSLSILFGHVMSSHHS